MIGALAIGKNYNEALLLYIVQITVKDVIYKSAKEKPITKIGKYKDMGG